MLNLKEPFDPTQTVLYQSIEQKGIEKGLERGKREGMKEIARKMLAAGKPMAEIMDFTGLDPATIRSLNE